MYRENTNASHIFLEPSEIWRLRDQFPSAKCFRINDKVACMRIITCNNIT